MEIKDEFNLQSKHVSIEAKGKLIATFFYYFDKYFNVIAGIVGVGLVLSIIKAFSN